MPKLKSPVGQNRLSTLVTSCVGFKRVLPFDCPVDIGVGKKPVPDQHPFLLAKGQFVPGIRDMKRESSWAKAVTLDTARLAPVLEID